MRRNRVKVLVVMLFAVVFAALGDISLSKGMKAVGAAGYSTVSQTAAAAITNVYVWAGIGFLFVFLILYLVSLSWEDLSFVLPLTGAIYVLVTLFAFFFLHEHVSALRWIGSVSVAVGIALVART
jgi:drug/metabolite transporter (DMT)-like permease